MSLGSAVRPTRAQSWILSQVEDLQAELAECKKKNKTVGDSVLSAPQDAVNTLSGAMDKMEDVFLDTTEQPEPSDSNAVH